MNFTVLKEQVARCADKLEDEKLRDMFVKCFFNTIDTTMQPQDDGSIYLITGDIDAMWLRDSCAQVMQYLLFADVCEDTRRLIKGLVKRQCYYILQDAYANSFNIGYNNRGHRGDECEHSGIVWERKFELDSLCYPIFLACKYFEKTGDAEIFTGNFLPAVARAIEVFEIEQHHGSRSDYYHFRPCEAPEFSVPNQGRGDKCNEESGLIWSGYRPSDDPCRYGFFIPGNMFVVSVMRSLISLMDRGLIDDGLRERAARLERTVTSGIEKYGVTQLEGYGKIYVYETDGLGNYHLMDDANVPSLLSIPYIGFGKIDDELYQNTRKFLLSDRNPFCFSGSVISGIGSPHTPKDYVWPISVIVQALTSLQENEVQDCIKMLLQSDNGTGYMHEGIHKDDASQFTRSWFAWANSLFAYLIATKLLGVSA